VGVSGILTPSVAPLNHRKFLESNLAARMQADLLCVGVEFVQMSRYEAECKLIARARAYPGHPKLLEAYLRWAAQRW